jgi:hypothetical protein
LVLTLSSTLERACHHPQWGTNTLGLLRSWCTEVLVHPHWDECFQRRFITTTRFGLAAFLRWCPPCYGSFSSLSQCLRCLAFGSSPLRRHVVLQPHSTHATQVPRRRWRSEHLVRGHAHVGGRGAHPRLRGRPAHADSCRCPDASRNRGDAAHPATPARREQLRHALQRSARGAAAGAAHAVRRG